MSPWRLMQRIPGGLIVLPGAIALFVSMAVLFRTQSVDLSRHDGVVASFRQLKELDAILNRQILESKFGVLPNYDPLVKTFGQLSKIHHRLVSEPSGIYHHGEAAVDKELDAYRAVLTKRAELLEQFKSENAVLRNSLHYFPGVAQSLSMRAEKENERGLSALVRGLLQDILLYNVEPTGELKSQILRVSEALLRLRIQSPVLMMALKNVLAHGQTILDKKQEVDRLVFELLSLPGAQRIDSLDAAYNRQYGEVVRQLTVTRVFLYLSSVVLLACVGYIMLRLERSRTELEQRATEQQRLVEELSRTQDQLLQSQKMEAIGRLAGGVAHDFNNLLTIILGRSEIVLSRMQPEEASRRDIELVKKTADRAAGLTRQLLAFSRKQVLQPKVLDLNEVVTAMNPMLQRLIGEDIQLATVQNPGLWRVKADAAQLEQIIMNLVVNSRDAMPNGGKLTLETANIVLDDTFVRQHPGARTGAYVVLAVTDTGTGMDAETLSHIFEPFFTTKEKGKGTGLGLSTVYGIVKQHEGYLAVDSKSGWGATFRIYLPRVDTPIDASQPEAPVPGSPGSETVLLVEDDEGVRDLAREVLQGSGYWVLEAGAPDQALRIARQHAGPLHILVTDVVMPQMSGRALAEQLVPLRPEMKVLYMSGYTDDAIVHHGGVDPGVALLQKPFTPEELARKVQEILNGR